MDTLSTRGIFCIRDAVDAIATAGGATTIPGIFTRLQGAPTEVQVATIQGLAKSSQRRVLREIYDHPELSMPDGVRNMLAHLIRKHEVVAPLQAVEIEI